MAWAVIMSTKNILFVALLSSYNFLWGYYGEPTGLKKFLIQSLSNTPVYISLVSKLELLIDISDFLLAHQYMRVPLNI